MFFEMGVAAHLLRVYRAKSARAQKNRTSLLRTRTQSALRRTLCALGAHLIKRRQYGERFCSA